MKKFVIEYWFYICIVIVIIGLFDVFWNSGSKRTHKPGWAKIEAAHWANSIAPNLNTNIICRETQYALSNKDNNADCSVNINGTIYHLFCNVNDDDSRYCILSNNGYR
jgi:hypothetical protein